MHVFLTGASGYIGSAVADRLRAAGHVVSGLARSDAAASRLSAAGIQPVRGNFTDLKSIGAAARWADGVISMATTYDPAVDGPAIGAMLAALAGSKKPMIYTSGIWSHGDTDGKVVDETLPPRPATLVQWRQAVEERVLDAARERIRAVVVRPAIVYGRGGGIPAEFVNSARKEGGARAGRNSLTRGEWAVVPGQRRGRSRQPRRGRRGTYDCVAARARSSSTGAPAGPMSSLTSSMDHISRRDRQVRQAAGQDGLGGSAFLLCRLHRHEHSGSAPHS